MEYDILIKNNKYKKRKDGRTSINNSEIYSWIS